MDQTTALTVTVAVLAGAWVLARMVPRLVRIAGWVLRCIGWVCLIAAVARFAGGMPIDGAVLVVTSVAVLIVGEVLHYVVCGYWHSRLLDAAIGGRGERVEVYDAADYFNHHATGPRNEAGPDGQDFDDARYDGSGDWIEPTRVFGEAALVHERRRCSRQA